MAGVLFIVNVPRKEHEDDLKKKERSENILIENYTSEKTKLTDEYKDRKGGLKTKNKSVANDNDNVILSKCKSTDCLHTRNRDSGLVECHSENALSENEINLKRKSYLMSSWEDVKEAMKPRRNKLKITEPGKAKILETLHWDTPLETILSEVIFRLDIKNAAWNSTKDDKFWQVTFSLESSNLCEELLQVLRTFGIGSRHHSSVSVIPCALYYKSDPGSAISKPSRGHQSDSNSAWSRFSSSMRARNNLAQILHNVRAEAALTFDWLFLLIVAAFVAAIGLVENSTVVLVASMLISPLMGPITAGTLGTAVRDRSLQQMGVMHELLGLFLSLVIGFIFGLAICAVDERYGVGDWPTYEMMSRCEIRSLWVGVLVAVPSGAGVALAVLGEYTASLVGVAISASLLPPAVNAGLLWAMALVHLVFMDDNTRWTSVVKTTIYSTNQPTELAVLGTVSLCLTLVNIICIFVTGVIVYKVKKVCPMDRRNLSWWSSKTNSKSSKYKEQNGGSSFPWDIYSEWCNEPQKLEQESQETADETSAMSKEIIQSDTVTYRRPQPFTQRLRAQNFEDFCITKAQVAETYIPIDDEKPSSHSEVRNDYSLENKNSIVATQNGRNKEKANRNTTGPNSINFSLHHMGFEENNNKKNKDRPTIDPSSNHTIDNNKRGGVVLGDKSFDV